MFRKLISRNFKIKNFQYFDCNYFISKENLTIEDQNEFIAIEDLVTVAKLVMRLIEVEEL